MQEDNTILNNEMDENELSNVIIGSALRVHRKLGPGVLESAYQECLFYELVKSGLFVEKQKALPLVYDEVKLECGYRIDLFVEKKVIVEIKSMDALAAIHGSQVLTYLRLSGCHLGLLINFNVVLLKDGIKRIVNNLPE
jgi:GxxExxY protein